MDPADDDFCRWDYYYRDANWSCRWWLLQIRRLLLKCQLTMQMMISADEKITITEIPIDPAEDDFYRDYYWDENNPCRWWDVRVITKIIALKAQKFWGHLVCAERWQTKQANSHKLGTSRGYFRRDNNMMIIWQDRPYWDENNSCRRWENYRDDNNSCRWWCLHLTSIEM